MAVPTLLQKGQRPAERVILQRRERERALAERAVVEPTPAEVRHREARLEQVLAAHVTQRLGEVEVILGRALVRLRPTAREGIEHDDPLAWMETHRRSGLVPDQETELIEQPPV